jgi:hypothetical protein
MNSFEYFMVCPCGRTSVVIDGLYHKYDPCPKCGRPESERVRRAGRWVSTAKFLRPSTWGTGYVLFREEHAEATSEPAVEPTVRLKNERNIRIA